MAVWYDVGRGGALVLARVVALARIDSAPVRRMVEAVSHDRIIDLTFGRPRRTVAVLDSGHIVMLSLAPQMVLEQLKEVNREDEPGE